jgi:hypothetical protein
MMKKVILSISVLLFLAGCYTYTSRLLSEKHITKLPYLTRAYQVQDDEAFPKPKHVSKAINVFYQYWVFKFGDEEEKVLTSLNSLMIEWGEKPKDISKSIGVFSIHGIRITNGTIRGVTVTPGYIWVWKGDNDKIHSTALVHELVHCALWSINSHADPDHEGTEYEGWTLEHTELIYEVNNLLADMNL